MKSIGIIPSRYASTRFPGKPLVEIKGKTMIQRVYEQSVKSIYLSKVIVATDDDRIYNHVKSFGGEVLMTDINHTNGTSRCNEIISLLEKKGENYDIAVNIQGDEPNINPEQIDSVVALFDNSNVQIGTLAKKVSSNDELFDPNVVKVVIGNDYNALYFSRHAIPVLRGIDQDSWLNNFIFFKHIGIYSYRTSVLKAIAIMPVGQLEQAEKLEQLRWLENGISISVDITDYESVAIDTVDDLQKLENIS
ncbi:MAG TPA: 3-deoxy-manno-octulosonate cytidylyltransferase [Bacteroidales bacterium]|nr:3-deoxy-manno-octulosonate cytidylyltransferase [Bacteroidota bacterium]HJN06871.1 3-deoxy-manno-octulosonate cytidylyltransferase [Bacteroidales bacterium]|tara:strand:+ start:1115 stop:1861 length:747 start_codon:yes stop_codon:yes gene_type:complete